jgi:organic radical activating enzyme
MCPNPTHKRVRGFMSLELFKRIIDDLNDIDSIREICLSGFGEPFLDKNIIKKIRYVKQNSNKSTLLFSNFGIVSKEQMKGVIDSNLDVLNISFNGSFKTYEKTMKLNFKTTKRKVETFLKIRGKQKNPLVIISCILNKYNEEEVKNLKRLWKDKVDGIYVGPPDNWVGNVDVKLNKNSYLNKRKKYHYPCKLFSPIINWKGEVGFCCRDFESRKIFGDMNNKKFLDIWYSPAYKDFRKRHYSGKLESVCAVCDVPLKQNGLKWWQSL